MGLYSNDGSYRVTIVNGGSGEPIPSSGSGALVDKSGTITTGGTAQTLAAANTTRTYFDVYNPDTTNDLWISFTTTATANGQGSIRVPANGGGYIRDTSVPLGAISIVGAVTGQKFTASER